MLSVWRYVRPFPKERRFEAIAIACDSRRPCSPCGICRQVMAEFAPDMRVIMVGEDSVIEQRVTDLLPTVLALAILPTMRMSDCLDY